jgi:hypothetical protein
LTCREAPDNQFNPTSRAGVAQLVERVLAKHEVVGSKPITRSIQLRSAGFEPGGWNSVTNPPLPRLSVFIGFAMDSALGHRYFF